MPITTIKPRKLVKVVVDRQMWFRGKGSGRSQLMITTLGGASPDVDGKMCCLGFAAIAMGIPKDMIRGRTTLVCIEPQLLTLEQKEWRRLSFLDLMVTNDAINNPRTNAPLSDAQREDGIKKHGLKVDLDFEFIN